MLITQSAMAVLAAALAALTSHGMTSVWPVYVISAASSAAGAFDLPARQALVPNLVPREHLPNAMSLNTIMFQVAAVTGPALGGIAHRAARCRLGCVANARVLSGRDCARS